MKDICLISLLFLFCNTTLAQDNSLVPTEQIFKLSGTYAGEALPAYFQVYDESDNLVTKPDFILFPTVYADINFDTDKGTLFVVYKDPKTKEKFPIIYEGSLNDEGLMFFKPKYYPSTMNISGIAGLRCDVGCKQLVIDIGLQRGKNFQQQQYLLAVDPN